MDEEDKAYEEIRGEVPTKGISMTGMAELFSGRVRDQKRFTDWLCKHYRYDKVAKFFSPRDAS
jgi:hypothetical protein